MTFIIVILLGVAARYLIPGSRNLIGFTKTIALSMIGSVIGSLIPIIYLYMTYDRTKVMGHYGYESRPIPEYFGPEVIVAATMGSLMILIVYGFIVHSASKGKMNNA